MDTWLDHLTAALLAGAVVLLLAAVWSRTQVSTVATTNTYRDRARIEVLRQTIDRDMARLGAGLDAADAAILAYSWTGPTRTFEFQGQIASAGAPDRVRYRATEAACADGRPACWRLQRQAYAGTGYKADGFDLVVGTAEVALNATPASSATGVDVRIVLEAPGLRPQTTADDPRRLPLSLVRYYRLVNQALRAS